MTLHKKTAQPASDELAELLKNNPDIFQQRPELLEFVTLADDRGTASLLERQVGTLKQRLQKFQSTQSELVEIARENEQISDSFSAIICQLIGFTNLSEFASDFPKALRSTFEIDEVVFKTSHAVALRPNENAGYDDALRRLSNNSAVCDNRWPSNIMSLFFDSSIKSAALIPMFTCEQGELIGILALGSNDPKRYTNELGTAHLNRLGLMAGICLARLLPASE